MRRLVSILVGASLAVFAIFLFSILHTTMPSMLLRAEDLYLDKQRDVVHGLFHATIRNTFVMADDIAFGSNAMAFAEGRYPEFIRDQWPGGTLLENYRFNFLIIKDTALNDLHSECYDYVHKTPMPVPPGFSDSLNSLARAVMDARVRSPRHGMTAEERGMGGIVFHDGVPYLLAIMPVIGSLAQEKPSGAVILGSILTNDYFRNLTQYLGLTFQLRKAGNAPVPARFDGDRVTITLPLRDIHGTPLVLSMSNTRTIYSQGRSILGRTTAMLIGTALLFAGALYAITMRLILRPVEAVSRDVTSASAANPLDPGKYSSSLEFTNLCTAINTMMQHLHQSNISLDVLQRILSGTDLLLYVSDFATDEILFVNDNMKRHFNLTDNVIGKTCWKVFQNGLSERCSFCPSYQLGNNPGESVVWEERSPVTDKYYRNTGSLIEWTDGRLAHLQHRVEITDIKKAEAALQKRLQQQELMSAMSRSFITDGDMNARISNALRMAGEFMDASRLLLATYQPEKGDLIFTHEWVNMSQNVRRLKGSSAPFRGVTPVHDAMVAGYESHVVHNDIRNMPEFAFLAEAGVIGFIDVPIIVDGKIRGVLGMDECARPRVWTESDVQLLTLIGSVISGVLTRNAMEAELTRLSSIVDSSPNFIAYVNADGSFKYVNDAAKMLLGHSVEDLKAGGFALILDREGFRRAQREIIPAILEKGRLEFELPLIHKDGEKRLFVFSAFTTDFPSGGIGAIAYDVTEQRKLEMEVLASKEQAESSSKAKGEFLSRMSHEIRTPLNAIIGMTGIARSSTELERKEYCLDKIESASTHLLGVINDILDMSKIEASKFELSFSEFNFESMLIRATNVINFRVEEKNQNLIVNLDRNVPWTVISDEQRLAQVIANLLSNAVKFTPEKGTITLSATMVDGKEEYCTLRIDVADTGIGISRENQAKLFTSFEQADGGIARKFGGTGLGLAISKNIVEMMGGSIWVTSEEGKGATFSFSIRVRRGAEAHRPLRNPDTKWNNLRVLVVDDTPEVKEFFHDFAGASGFSCHLAASAGEARALLEKHGGNYYNVIFMDWKMPDTDVMELARHFRERSAAGTVVFLISALEWSMVEQDARAVGVDKFVSKPLFLSVIVDCINECLDKNAEIALNAPPGRFADECFIGKRILLVEDIEVNREIVVSLLENTGVSIESAENGRAAVEKFRDDPDRFDAIFMDIHMPEVDGYEATRMIRAIDHERARSVPIIAMTANVFREDIEKCLAAGMNDHVGKPIDMAEMVSKLGQYLGCSVCNV